MGVRIVVERVVIAGLAVAPDPGELQASLVRSLQEAAASGALASGALAVPDPIAGPEGDAGRPGLADRGAATLRVDVEAGQDLGSALGAAIAGTVGRA
jgi:hypothetical protein